MKALRARIPARRARDEEVEALKQSGAVVATLGKRILRTETAPLAALVSIMLLTDNMN